MSLMLAHVSDFHISAFGDTFHDRQHAVRRSARKITPSERGERLFELSGFTLFREREGRRERFLLIDDEGYGHAVPTLKEMPDRKDLEERAARKVLLLGARRAATLAAHPPEPDALARMLEETPSNTNLRLLQAARAVRAQRPDIVLATGDLTDDGQGYELIESVFGEWRRAGRLLAVPGNHDLYLFPIAGSARPAPTHQLKREAWQACAARLGLRLDESGGWCSTIERAGCVIVGLDSCARRQPRFYRHNGAIGSEQLRYLRRIARTPEWRYASHRIVAFHHHVVPLPYGVGRRAPTEIGMRLDDAKEVAEVLNEVSATFVLHGHRHISEQRQPAGCGFQLLAAPSLTLGCKSGDVPSFWALELDRRAHATRVRVTLAPVEQENDPLYPPSP